MLDLAVGDHDFRILKHKRCRLVLQRIRVQINRMVFLPHG